MKQHTVAEKTTREEATRIAALIEEGDLAPAVTQVEALLAREPQNAEAFYLKGLIFMRTHQAPEAIACFNQAMKFAPDHKKACELLGGLLAHTGQIALSIKIFGYLLKLEMAGGGKPITPISAAADKAMREIFERGVALDKKGDLENAAAAFRKALSYSPERHEAMANLGLALHGLRRFTEAEEILLACIRTRPEYAPSYNLLGNVYKDTGRLTRAIACYQQAAAVDPAMRHPWANLGKTYYEMQLFAEAAAAYENTLRVDPEYAEALSELLHQHYLLCRWEKTGELSARLAKSIEAGQCAEPFIFMVHGPAGLQRENAQRWSRKLYPMARAHDPARPLPADARGDGKLRIGYYSSDFHHHATAALISEMFERHDRALFSVYAYSYGVDDGGPERARIMKAVDTFRDIRTVDDREAAALIESDGIDILVDLKGYTQGHRLSLPAMRPAPVQMHYLGYPGTMGAKFLDYFIADAVTAPESEDAHFTEALIRLPGAYQINDRARPLPDSGPARKEYGLPAEGFVFGAFNNSYKIMPEIFAVWMRILGSIEGSVLWLYETQEEATRNLRTAAEKRGIAGERLVTCRAAPLARHLARYRHVDLCLDTSPVCGHTTTSDALWCGVPVVALKGESFISRVSESLLAGTGLSELVAADLEAFETLAVRLARAPKELARLRKHLADGRMVFPLFDSEKTTRALERAYIEAARRQREGLKPEGFNVD